MSELIDVMPGLALTLGLGMRHGLAPDHLAAIDGLTVRAVHERSRWAPWMGGLFAAGHGLVMLLVVVAAASAPAAFRPDQVLFERLEWLPPLFLLFLAVSNARRLQGGAARAAAPRGWTGRAGPLPSFVVGMLFALGFETALQAALWGYSASALGGMPAALALASVFVAGMALTDACDGWITAHVMRNGSGLLVARYRRRMGWPIVVMCAALGGYLMAAKLCTQCTLGEDWSTGVGAAMMLALAAFYGWTLAGVRRERARLSGNAGRCP